MYTAEALCNCCRSCSGKWCTVFGKQLLSIYTENPAVIDAGMKRMNVIARTYALCGMMDVMDLVPQGTWIFCNADDCVTYRCMWIETFVDIYIFQEWSEFHTVTSLYLTYTWSWIITFLAHVIWIIVRQSSADNGTTDIR